MNPTTGRQPPVLILLTACVVVSTTGKNWRLDWGPPGRRRPSHRSREGVSEAKATRKKKRPSPACACPLWSSERPEVFRDDERAKLSRTTRRAGRPMARPVPGRGETCDRGHPRRLSETNGMHGASGYRVRTDAEYATPLAGPTYRARTRYRLAGPRSAGEKLPAGTWERPAVPRWNPRASAWGGCQTSGTRPTTTSKGTTSTRR